MKTQVITLDAQDDVVSICDKMQWTKTERLLLVFPRKSLHSLRTLDLLRLQRHAATLAVQLGLLSRSKEMRRAAQELGIPVFMTAIEAQNATWPEKKRGYPLRRSSRREELRELRREAFPREASWRNHPTLRISLFSLAAITILALLIILLPSATVTLSPKHEKQSTTLDLSASPEVFSVTAMGDIPSKTATVDVEGSKTVSITSKAYVPDQPAEGVVRFTNLSMEVIGIPAGTIVRTLAEPMVRFSTLQDGVLTGQVGKSLDIPVRAINPGTTGNIPANEQVLVEGSLGASVSATNPEPISGGSDRLDFVPSTEDRALLRAGLLADLRNQAVKNLTGMLEPGSTVFPDTLLAVTDLTETYLPEPDQPGKSLTMTISGKFQCEYAAGKDLMDLETAVLDASLPAGYEALTDSLTEDITDQPITDTEGVTHWTVDLERFIRLRIDPQAVAFLVQGRRPVVASQRLSVEYQLANSPEIKRVPSFWPWLPATILRIAIIIN